MRLTVGKTRGFVIHGSRSELRQASMLPGSVWRTKESIVRLPENLASWKALRAFPFDDVDNDARDALTRLKQAYREHRRVVRLATRRFKMTGETDIPVPLISIPMEHQTRAFGFCSMLTAAALFMDMGTGKTLVAIALAIHRAQESGKVFRLFVACPKAVKPVWPREFGKHTDYPVSIGIDGPPAPLTGFGIELWVTNYDRVKREVSRIKKWKPDMITLDESHRIKNRKAARTKAISSLKSEFRLMLSGTPFGKCISEVWSQFHFLRPDLFGSFTQFRENYMRMGGYMGYKVVGYKNQEEFSDKLHSIAFRVTKDECMDLPPLSYQRLYVEADKRAKEIYEEMDLNYYFEEGGEEVSVDREATKQMKLRQIVGGLVKSDGQELVHVSNMKASTLEELLEDRTDDKTVIYFSFTHEIEIAKKICEKLGVGYLTLQGSTPEKARAVFEDQFQDDPAINVALIQIATGAEGMTLTAADTIVFYSPSFSYIGYTQARDRINRKGQLRPMNIIFILMKDTVDERVVDVLESNRQLTDNFMESQRNYTMATKTTKAPAEKAAPKAAVEKTGYTASQMAESLNIEPAELRKHLRAANIEKPAAGWTWANEKAAASVRKAVETRIKELASAPAKEKAAPKAKVEGETKPAKKTPVKSEATDAPKTPAKKVAKKPAKAE